MLWSRSTTSKSSFAACKERESARSEQTETRSITWRLTAQVRRRRRSAPAPTWCYSTCLANAAVCTHIIVPDVGVVFSEHLQARREALHETAAPVVTDGCAADGAGERQEQQDGEQRASRHFGGLLEKDAEAGCQISEVHAMKLILNLIYRQKSGRSLTGLNLGIFFSRDVHHLWTTPHFKCWCCFNSRGNVLPNMRN